MIPKLGPLWKPHDAARISATRNLRYIELMNSIAGPRRRHAAAVHPRARTAHWPPRQGSDRRPRRVARILCCEARRGSGEAHRSAAARWADALPADERTAPLRLGATGPMSRPSVASCAASSPPANHRRPWRGLEKLGIGTVGARCGHYPFATPTGPRSRSVERSGRAVRHVRPAAQGRACRGGHAGRRRV